MTARCSSAGCWSARIARCARCGLILDLSDVTSIDPINLGTVVALCDLADDQHVIVFIDNACVGTPDELRAAGVPPQRLPGPHPGRPGSPVTHPESRHGSSFEARSRAFVELAYRRDALGKC